TGAPEPKLHETTTQNGISAKQSTGTELQQPMAQQPPRSPNNQTGTYPSIRHGNTASTPHRIETAASTSNFTTPRRPARGVEFPTPAVVIIQTPSAWTRFDTRQGSQFSLFTLNPAISQTEPSARIEDVDQDILHPEHPSSSATHWNPPTNSSITTGSTRDSDVFSETQAGRSDPIFHSDPLHSQNTVSEGASTSPTSQAQSTALILPTSNFSRMSDTIRHALLPASATRSLSSSTAMVRVSSPNVTHASYAESLATSGGIYRSHSASYISRARLHTGSATRANSLAHDDWNSREGSTTRDSPAPSTISGQSLTRISSSHNGHQHVHQPQRSLRQRDFTYEQVVFMKAMNKRWHWYLISDDTFPINTGMALELCTQYAEQTLELSRKVCGIGRPSFDFVRRKDSSIRNSFQTGLLSILEEGYGVNIETTDKLNELISQSNFIYAEYDIETKKVSGRYRHPCLLRVLAAVLFTKSKRGRPIGAHFMPEIMGGTDSTDSPMEPGGTGITVPMIALACTL
ncbi:hypothetical protein FRC11_001959, partial [Ceratobasidium sp. 423]